MYIFHRQLTSGSSTTSTIYRAAAWRTKRAARWTGRALHLFIVLMMTLLPVAPLGAMPAYAEGGDFKIDFVAAAPESYNHLTGGGAYDDRTIGVDKDVVESLEGGDFACGDIITYFAAVTVDDTQSAFDDEPQTIEMDFSFLGDATGQPGVAIGDVVLVEVNYDPIEDLIDGENNNEEGNIGDNDSTATNSYEHLTGPLFQAGTELLLTVELDDLEHAEQVVVRIDVKLFCDPGSSPTGNLQAAFSAARLTHIKGGEAVTPEAIPSGAQTIPFKKIGDVATPAIDVQKTVTTVDGTCGIDDAESLTITSGDTVKYCYVVINEGDVGANLFNVTLSDDNGTPGNISDDFSVTLSGLTDVDSDGSPDDLFNGDIVTGEALVTIDGPAVGELDQTIVNTAKASGDDAIILPTTLTDTDTATVIVEALVPVAPQPRVIKGNEEGNDTVATLDEPGGSVAINVVVYNDALPLTGDATLTLLVDDIYFDITTTGHDGITATDCETGGVIVGGGSYSCSFTVDIASAPRTITDTVTATLSNGAGTVTDDDQANVVITDLLPNFTVQKLVDADDDEVFDDITEEAAQGAIVTYKLIITNNSSEALVISSISDDVYSLVGSTCETLTSIPGNSSVECTFAGTAPNDDNQSITDTITVVGSDNDGNSETQTDDANITTPDILPDITVSKTANPTALYEPGGVVEFTIVATNNSLEDVTIDSLSDSDFDLAVNCPDAVDTVLGYQGTYTCVFTEVISGDFSGPAHENIVTVEASDDDGKSDTATDNATVDFLDLEPTIQVTKTANPTSVPETGGDVTFTFLVENIGDEDVTLTSLTDTVFDDLNGQGTCATGGLIPIGGSYSCSITVFLASDSLTAHYNVATAVGTDDDGTTDDASDDETVTFEDVLPDITITKTANPTSVLETGGNVEFTIIVTNNSLEDATIDSLVDSDFDLAANCPDAVGTELGYLETYTCVFTEHLTGDDLVAHENTATVVALDDDGNSDTASDDETVTFTDVEPDIMVTKTADAASVPETGGYVIFTFLVDNIGVEDVTLTSLNDDMFGNLFDTDLNPTSTCESVNIPVGGSYSCSLTVFLASDTLTDHYNVVTAVGTDDDDTTTEDTDDETVTFTDVAPDITITKSASPSSVPETGGDVTFTFLVENIGDEDVTLTSLTDTVFDDLNGQGTCATGGLIPIGGSYSCSITVFLASDSLTAHYNVATAVGTDDDGTTDTDTDDETVTFTDVAPDISVIKTGAYNYESPAVVPETGGYVIFTFLVDNIGVEDVTLTSLNDDMFGNLFDKDLNPTSTCESVNIPVGGSYSCSLMVFLASDTLTDHYNVVTAVGTDDDDTTTEDTDDETVTFTDVAPDITITKSASPSSVPETGGDVTFTFLVENIGDEDVTLTSLTDTVFDDLNGQGTCATGGLIPIGGSYSCSITVFLASDSLTAHYNVATAVGTDDDGTTDDASDDETVTFEDVLPDITITKTANPTSVLETGGNVEFTIIVTNNSLEDATIDSLVDSDFDLAANCPDAVGTELGYLETYTCVFTEHLTGDDLVAHENTATVVALDDDGNSDTASDDETVTFTDVLPDIAITKTANPTSVLETGGNVEFTIIVTNNSLEDATIDSLVDSDFDLAANCPDAVGTELGYLETYTCVFTEHLTGDDLVAHENTATVVALDDDGNSDTAYDDETVTFTDVLPDIAITKTANPTSVLETGGNVEFTIIVTNNSLEDATIDSLVDSDFDLAANCPDAVGTELGYLETYTCVFTEHLTGDDLVAHENTATVVALDDDGNSDTAYDNETVTFTDVLPDIAITKTANPTSVLETGGNVEFTIIVTNNSLEDATIDSLVDSDFDLAANCPDAVGTELGYLETYTCVFTEHLTGDDLVAHENTATVVALDDDGNSDTAYDDETVTFTDVLPDIAITKTANPTSVLETGGNVEFTIIVTNNSLEDATIDSLVDSDFDLAANCPDAVGTELGYLETYTCVFTEHLTGDDLVAHENTATVVALDDDGNSDTAYDNETVTFTDVLPDIAITKTANPTSVLETGGNVEFTIIVTNNSLEDATIDSLVDSDFDLAANCPDAVGTELGYLETYTCVFTEHLTGDDLVAHENTATVVALDDDGNSDTAYDNETVTFTDVLPDIAITKTANPTSVLETGGNVEFTIIVTNNSLEDATIDSLVDSDFDLAANCPDAVGTELGYLETYTCVFTEHLTGDDLVAHENTATVVALDDDGNSDTAYDNETVTFTDVLPDIAITKTANPTSVLETGGNVEFTIIVTNNSLEDATIDSLVDSDFDLAANCPDAVGTELGYLETYTCVFTEHLTGDDLVAHENTATVVALDDDGNSDTAYDNETVTFEDVLPDISVSKTATPENVPSTGAVVTFQIIVTNHNSEDVTLDSLTDDIYGDLTQLVDVVDPTLPEENDFKEQLSTTCSVTTDTDDVTIAGNEGTYQCEFTAMVSGTPGISFGSETDTVTAAASDNDGNSDEALDSATVTITPPIYVTDSALCTFDVDGDLSNGRQFLNLLSMDPQNPPYFKVTATNPGQFYYNMSVSGVPGEEVVVTLQIPWPFVTQGARPVHVYGGVSLYTNELGQTCYMPDYDLETQAIDNYIQLNDYYDKVDDFDPGDSGYTEGAYVEVTLDITIPDSGFAYINQHMDYGLKDRDANPDGYVMDAHETPEGSLEDAVLPGTQTDLKPVVLIPDLADHVFYTFLVENPGEVDELKVELGSDSVQNDNEFKTNPGIAGLVIDIVCDDLNCEFTHEEYLADAWIRLVDSEGFVVGQDRSDEHGWYQIVYKHLGRPTNYTFEAYIDLTDNDNPDELTPELTRIVELKGNEFEEVFMYRDSTVGQGLDLDYVHVAEMVPGIKPGPKTWNATVDILVVADGDVPVANAQVSGIWGEWGGEELGFCVTDVEGWCVVALAKIPNDKVVSFRIVDIAADGYFYNPTDPGAVVTTGSFPSP